MSIPKIRIAESFVSLQGEGARLGYISLFVRLAGCNLRCGHYEGSKWKCDTYDIMNNVTFSGYASDYAKQLLLEHPWFFEQAALGYPVGIVFTGGEPLLQQAGIAALLKELESLSTPVGTVELETNGTMPLSHPELLDALKDMELVINCSPKLSSSGIPKAERKVLSALSSLAEATEFNRFWTLSFKFVVANESDVIEVLEEYCDQIVKCDRYSIILMPAAATREQLVEKTREIWPLAQQAGLRMSTRLQILAYDKRAGV